MKIKDFQVVPVARNNDPVYFRTYVLVEDKSEIVTQDKIFYRDSNDIGSPEYWHELSIDIKGLE